MLQSVAPTFTQVLKYSPEQKRGEKGTPEGGRFVKAKFDPNQPRDEKGRWAEQQLATLARLEAERAAQFGPGKQEHTTTEAMRREPLPKTLAEAEDRIRYEQREHAFLIKDGKPFKVLGDDDRHHVKQDGATDADLRDSTLTHNHPSGYGLSNKDGISAAKWNLQEMRAVTATGTHVIRRTGDTWPQDFGEKIIENHADLMTELAMRLHDGDISIEEANTLHHKMMYQRLQKQLGGFTYTFEPKS